LSRKLKYFLASLFVTGWLFFIGPSYAWATDNGGQEQVVVSPAQQAVNTALGVATTEVQQAIAATDSSTALVSVAQTELSQAQAAVTQVTQSISTATTAINLVDTATATINNINIVTTPTDQSSQIVQDAKLTVTAAQTSIDSITVTAAQTEISQVTAAKTAASTAQSTAQTELTQANIAIDNAQTAVNNLQATIGTTVNVLAGVDDAGVQMNLPFGMQMGGTVYNNVYVGSNATVTFGVNEGPNYYSTPNAPSVSIAGWDWTTWSTGTGITYSTTGTSLDIAWDLRPYPQQDASTQMVQIRFNADVNPNDGAWMANVTAVGPIPNGARFNYRETTNGAITSITDTNSGTGFAGQISQGASFTPYVDPNTSTVQAAVDAANATITQLNQSLSPVVSQNTLNTYAINAINTNSLTNTLNSAVSTKTSLQSTLNTKSNQLITAINNNIPTPAPIISQAVVDGTTVTVTPELPSGYTPNTWFYQVITNDPTAENPYAGGTYNTDGAPESIQLTGLTEGASYIVRIANWSGPVSQYVETIITIPQEETISVPSQPSYITPTEPIIDEPIIDEPVIEEPIKEEPVIDEPVAEEPELTVEEAQEIVSDLIEDGNLTAEDANAILELISEGGEVSEEVISEISSTLSEGGLSIEEAELITEILSADGEITVDEVINLSEALSEDGIFTLAEKDLVADVLVTSAEGAPVEAAAIEAAGLEYRDLPPLIPVEVREDANGNPVVITAEVASALLTLESPAALVNAIAGCFNPDEAIEGLTEEQQCEVFKALSSIGADMSPEERQDAKEVLVAAILVGQVILGSTIMRIRG
jgi:polyhydroxyalkanoate synthesis regulator phasin